MSQVTYPIYGIDYRGQTLYVELIQVVESRQLAWVRPLMLLDTLCDSLENNSGPRPSVSSKSSDDLEPALYDLQAEADLLCPPSLLRQALDTEVLPLLTQLAQQGDRPLETGHLHRFVQKICLGNPELFQSSGRGRCSP